MKFKAKHLEVDIDESSGQLRAIRDLDSDREIIAFDEGHECEINGLPLPMAPIETKDFWGCPMTRFDVRSMDCYLAGARYELQRVIVPGEMGAITGRGKSVHFRHTLRRIPWGDWEDPLDDLWEHPIEAPEMLKSFSALCAPTPFFGAKTHIRAVAIGGGGPREHVSLEDGPFDEVLPWLQTRFRTSFPGQSTVPGALYYHPEDERWVWIVVRHPSIGGDIRFSSQGQAFNFYPFQNMEVHDRIAFPDISIYYGQGLDEADAVLASLFDLYEEPPPWWFHTTWFWLHPLMQPNASFDRMKKTVDLLVDECGVNGFGILSHDRAPGSLDCECDSPMPSSILGGESEFKKLVAYIREKGCHTYVWMARYGKLGRGGPSDWRDEWALRGIDSRPVGHEVFRMCDSHAPGFRDYLKKWVEYNIGHIGIDGIFWDSAFQPMVPNFSDASKAWLNCPGEAAAGGPDLYREIYHLGKQLNPDFFMWGEGISTECVMNAFAVDDRCHGEHSGHALMHRIAHAGPRRLVWRSAWSHDVAGAFPFINPVNDIGKSLDSDFYEKVAADPANRWLCKIVKERGCRQAHGIADGIAVLDEFIVVSPDSQLLGVVRVPDAWLKGTALVHELSGSRVEGQRVSEGVEFTLTETGPWRMV